MRLKGKRAIVTGANGGIGQAICRLFSREGADVAMIDRVTTACDTVAEEMKGMGRNPLVIRADLNQSQDINKVVDQANKGLGKIDILVSNAGVTERLAFEEIEPNDWDYIFGINLKASFFTIQASVQRMKVQKEGSIICIGSRASKDGGVNVGISYAASKAGLELLVKRLSKELGPFGVRINLIRPGPIDTPMLEGLTPDQKAEMARAIPLGRLGSPGDVAMASLFLASDESSFISGAILDVAGGL
jgi:NAD(P)-dependent dehydrogenase (short-subunit alcohol dehydrogenase family)